MAKSTKTKAKNLYAFLVAINNYPIERHKLNGCISDRDALNDYINRNFKDTEVKLNIKTLTDKEATKANIIKGFQHFQKAKDGDICVFYFSGHGSQAPAPKEFWHLDPDRMNESVVCYDSRVKGGKDLMDKEQAYLIYEATKGKDVHFVAIFDCCHAGSNTRGLEDAYVSRMAEPSNTPSTVEDYYGYKHYKKVKQDGYVELTPPTGTHIQFAASRANETAKEVKLKDGKFRGIFTYYMIKSLEQTNSQLSYAELINAINIKVSAKIEDQSPIMDVVVGGNGESVVLSQGLFLNGSIPVKKAEYTIVKKGNEWILDAGAVHGIPREGGTLELEDKTEVTISEVLANHSVIDGMDGQPNKIHRAVVKKMGFDKMQVAIAKGSNRTGVSFIKGAFKAPGSSFVELVRRKAEADYLIHCKENSYQLCRPGDDRPVFRRINEYNDNSAISFLMDVEKVARYHNLTHLDNPRTTISEDEYKIELFRTTDPGNEADNAPKELVDTSKPVLFRYQKVGNKWKHFGFQMKITNTSHRPLFFSTLYMSSTFGIKNDFMAMEEVAPGQEVWCMDAYKGKKYKTIPLKVPSGYQDLGIIEISEHLKVFISTDKNLKTTPYHQKSLKLDKPTQYAGSKDAGRGGDDQPEIPDWTTRTIQLKVIRPLDEVKLADSSKTDLMGVKIQAPKGMEAMVAFSNAKEAERSLVSSDAALPPPDHLWGNQEITQPFEFNQGYNDSPGLSVLEFKSVNGGDQLNSENPLVVSTGEKLKEDEFIVPMGYDQETGMYFPLGISDEKGNVAIETLPAESDPPPGERSLTGSIKIFFQKVVLTKLGFEYKHPQLALPVFEAEDGEEFTYELDKAKIKKALTKAKSIAIFMHGIIGDTTEMARAARRIKKEDGTSLENTYDLVLTFDYENLKTEIQQTAKDLGKRLNEVGLKAGHGKTVHIIAHSMGGLVSRWFIEKEGGNKVINHLFQVGTPNAGSPWADVYELSSALLSKAVNGAAFLKPYVLPLSLLGKYAKVIFTTLQQMDPDGSKFLKELNDGCDPGIPYTIIAGNTKLVKVQYEKQQSILKRLVKRFKSRGHYDALDVLLFKEANDIAVSVKSIYGIKDMDKRKFPPKKLEVGCDHISYFADPDGLKSLAEAVFSK